MNVVQIGLGTFGTFIQNLAGERHESDNMISWLLKSCSERQPSRVTGVSVEPVPEHIQGLRAHARRLPNMELVQVAVGGEDLEGTQKIYVLSSATHQALLSSVPKWQRWALEADLLYLRNMSCVGGEHPAIQKFNERFRSIYGLTAPTEPLQISVWSYSRLASEFGFCGCEVLLVDAEGCDTQILRSMVAHCEAKDFLGSNAWPEVIQFETMGHCDQREGVGAEANMVTQLKKCGYLLVYWNYYNMILVRRQILKRQVDRQRSQHLQKWIRTLRCKQCRRSGQQGQPGLPYTTHAGNIFCWQCYKAWRHRCD